MNHFLKKIIFITLIFIFAHAASASLPNRFSALYVFGDSLSDIGNFHATNQNCLQTGGTSAPVTNHTGGAFPGKLWVNFLSEDFNFNLSKGSLKHKRGTDWAVAGSLTLDVVRQIQNYVTFNQTDPNALYAIWAGSNDIEFRLDPANQDPNHPVTPQQVVLQGIMNIFGGMALLYNHGARNFLVIGVPDASLTPGVLFAAQNNPNLISQVHAICQGWNQALFDPKVITPGSAPLAYLKKLFPDIKIFVWNPTPLFERAVADPAALGFPPTINGIPNNQNVWCTNPSSNPDDYLFYNGLHPTSHAHQIISSTLINEAVLF